MSRGRKKGTGSLKPKSLIPIKHLLKEGQWKGQRAFIVGGGPSLKGFPWEKLHDERVIACNKSHECGVADLVMTGDRRWLTLYAPCESLDPKVPVILARTVLPDPAWSPRFDTYYIATCVEKMWGTTFEEGVSRGGSGIRAANLAAILGADPIYLLGFDMGFQSSNDEQNRWHEGYITRDCGYYKSFIAWWEKVIESGQIDVSLFNLSLTSKLPMIPRLSLEEVFGE